MIRGIEGRRIFRDDGDRLDFLERLDRLVPELAFRCFASVLMPNHVHLAVQSGSVHLSRFMARLNTGYARSFNLRHRRGGYLFQGRFRSRIVCGEADLIAVKGRHEAVHVFALLGGPEMAKSETHRDLEALHERMLGAYRSQNWSLARELLEQCARRAPNLDRLYDVYRDRIGYFEQNPPGKYWNGVFVARQK